MRRVLLSCAAILALTGCRSGPRPGSDTAAVAGPDELTSRRLAQLAAGAPNLPLSYDVIESLAMRWVEYSLFGLRAAAGDRLEDSATITAVAWPDFRGTVVDSFRAVRLAGRIRITPEEVDSAYRAGNVRFLSQILKRVPPGASASVRDSLRRVIAAIRGRLAAGGSWADANAQNDDPRSRAEGGALGMVTRGQTVPAFEKAAFALAPGEISGVVETTFGFHVIYRPPLAEIRDAFAAGLIDLLAAPLDSAYQAGLLAGKHVRLADGAGGAVRLAVADPLRSRGLDLALATWDGGRFTVADFVRYVAFLPPGFEQQVQAAPDGQLADLVRSFVIRELEWRAADSARVTMPATRFRQLVAAYQAQMKQLRTVTRLDPDSLARAASSHSGRQRAADRRVDRFFEAALGDPRLAMPLSPGLAQYLLDRGDWSVSADGVERALLEAAMLRTARLDSSAAARPQGAPPPRQGR